MRSVFLFFILFFAGRNFLDAQTDTISLAQALERGLANRPELRSAQWQVQLAENRNAKIRAQWRPQVRATGDFRVNTQLQKSVIPVGAFGLPNTPADATATVAFGVPFQNLAGIDINQKIYDAQRPLDRAFNETYTQARQLEREQIQRDIRWAIIESYLDLMWQGEKLRYSRESLKRTETALDYESERSQNGAAQPNDYYRALLDKNNAELNAVQALRDFENAGDYLKYLMADTSQASVFPAETLASFAPEMENRFNKFSAKPIEWRLEENARQQNALLERKERARLRPDLSAFGNYSILALNDQLSTFNYLGLRLTLPLYDGRQSRLAAEDYRLQQQINAANLDKLQNDIHHDLISAELTATSCYNQTRFCENNLQIARKIYENTQNGFKQGAIVLNDLKADELVLQTAEFKYLESLHALLVAKFNLLKAKGLE